MALTGRIVYNTGVVLIWRLTFLAFHNFGTDQHRWVVIPHMPKTLLTAGWVFVDELPCEIFPKMPRS